VKIVSVKCSIAQILLLLVLLSAVSNTQSQEDYKHIIYVPAGQTVTIDTPGLKRVAIGDGKIADVKVLRDTSEVLIIAKESGVTDLRVWYRKGFSERYLIQVDGISPGPNMDEVQKLLGDIAGIEIVKVRNTFLIDGEVTSKPDKVRIDAIAAQYPNIVSLVADPLLEKSQTILIKAQLLEVKKSALKKIGVNWEDVLNGPVFSIFADYRTNDIFRSISPPTGGNIFGAIGQDVGTNTYLGISSSLTSVINILMNDGDAKILAEPTLSCTSGGEANFLAGGEIPIPLVDGDGAMTVQFKQYGILLDISPVTDGEGFISTSVEVEVSAVDQSVEVLGIPGFTTRRAETEMNVQAGETMVIAGLVSHNDAKNVDKVPGLGQIPILGELFKSREFVANETELIVLITPQLLESGDKLNKEHISRFGEMSLEVDERMQFDILD
jgi:pilus assembly protein CpaC